MLVTKEQLINFLEEKVFSPTENNPNVTTKIKRKINTTRMRLNNLASAEKVEEYFWHSMATDHGIDSYNKISQIDGITFEDVREEFKKLCGRK